ncbi:MAG: D-xylose ABC transporter ATP-binding protein, partial [Verrucomicrobiaceae bacterium]|nr:D-xylose ABC transporter ATP-binding protein [Verrucomicrobiaceae bacterium]
MAADPDSHPLLEARAISKRFGGVRALEGVSASFHAGEVVAVMGENGAGKSTLMKCLAGVHQPNAGEVAVDGNLVSIPDVRAAEKLGVAFIHQELNLAENLNIGANVYLGREPRKFGPFFDQ